jgi:hypothetical protein
MGMFLAVTQEDPKTILSYIQDSVLPVIPENIGEYDAYYLLLPEKFSGMSSMFVTKFVELFGSKVLGRAFTCEQTKHAKTVVPNDSELFISFGEENTVFGTHRIHIPLHSDTDFAAMMAVGYAVIGHIQKHKPPFFKESIARYMKEASLLFDTELSVIVE